MSFLSWFTQKNKASDKSSGIKDSSGLGHVDATVPFNPSAKGGDRFGQAAQSHAVNRKTERLERREQLYGVVRESLTSAGILSASYKFKVLSLDSRGRQYLIMMDIDRRYVSETDRLAVIERLIAHNAKSRYDILITSVYWRVNETVTAGLSRPSSPVPLSVNPSAAPAQRTPAAPGASKPRYEPLHADEVAAFKQALATAAPSPATVQKGELVRSGRRNPAPLPTFEDTQIDDSGSPLSGTQYGDLN
ncbi:MAG: hypothetical protein RIR09_1857 [Pseudomonadota bacterium]|jgi:hypothetical protein